MTRTRGRWAALQQGSVRALVGALVALVLGTVLAVVPGPALAEVPQVAVDRMDPAMISIDELPAGVRHGLAVGVHDDGAAGVARSPLLPPASEGQGLAESLLVAPSAAAGAAPLVGAQVSVAPFHTVGVQVSSVPSNDIWVRVRTEGRWGEWLEMHLDLDIGPDGDRRPPYVSQPVWVDDSDAYQVMAPPDAVDLRLVVVRDDGTRLEPVLREDEAEANAAPGRPAIGSRASWGARDKRGAAVLADGIQMAIVHHTVSRNDYGPNEVPGILRSIQAFHQDGNGWSDIAYNFLVDRYGRIWEGNTSGMMDLPVVGGHSRGFNTGTVGVSMIGDFTSVAPPQAAVDAVGDVVGWKLAISGVDPRTRTQFVTYGNERYARGTAVDLPRIVGHRDTGATSCPGVHLYARLDQVTERALQIHLRDSDPFGTVEVVRGTDYGEVRVEGWAMDPDARGSIDVHVYVDGVGRANVPTYAVRPDVAAAYPWIGTTPVQYSAPVKVGAGEHEFCAYGINRWTGSNTLLGCVRGRAPEGSPFGAVEKPRGLGPELVEVTGWAIDPDTAAAVDVHIYVDGVGAANIRADRARPDVGARWPGWGPGHGFSTTVRAPAGASVCAYGIDRVAPGSPAPLGCQRAETTTGSPFGRLEGWSPTAPGTVQVSGWAIDPDTAAPVGIHLYDETGDRPRLLGTATADRERADLGAAFPGWGSKHAYRATFLMKGERRVCAYAIDAKGGHGPTQLGCRWVGTPNGSPVGSLDAVIPGPRSVRLFGWTLDPDVASSTNVHIYVDGVGRANLDADEPRADVAARYPAWSTGRGFSTTITGLAPGQREVCAYGIDADGTAHSLLRCRTVTVPTGSPRGALDVASATDGGLRVAGWGIDPDTDEPVHVHVYVDGVGRANVKATTSRPDLAGPFPLWSRDHGFDLVIPGALSPGTHQVCVYLIDRVGGHGPTLTRCVSVQGGAP